MAQVKPDVIVAWPTHIDYPGWRKQLHQYRHLFNNVVVLWSGHGVNYGMSDWLPGWVINAMHQDGPIIHIPTSDSVKSRHNPFDDWAQRLYHVGLKHVSNDYLLFTQQDFVCRNDKLFETVFDDQYRLVSHHEGDGVNSGFRLEPDFIFVHMPTFRQTSMDVTLGPHPVNGQALDHWGPLSYEVRNLCPDEKTLEDLGFEEPKDWTHIGGFAMNSCMLWEGRPFDNLVGHHRREFIEYHRELMTYDWTDVPMHPAIHAWIDKIARVDIPEGV